MIVEHLKWWLILKVKLPRRFRTLEYVLCNSVPRFASKVLTLSFVFPIVNPFQVAINEKNDFFPFISSFVLVSTAVTYDKSIKAIRVKVPDSEEEFLLHPATVRRNDRSAQSVVSMFFLLVNGFYLNLSS